VIVPDSASRPRDLRACHERGVSTSTSPAKEKWNFALSRNKKRLAEEGSEGPARRRGILDSDDTIPLCRERKGDVHEPGDLRVVPASVITRP